MKLQDLQESRRYTESSLVQWIRDAKHTLEVGETEFDKHGDDNRLIELIRLFGKPHYKDSYRGVYKWTVDNVKIEYNEDRIEIERQF